MAEMMVRRIGVFSLAKIQALLMFVMGIIIGVIYGLIFMLFGAAMSSVAGGSDLVIGGVSSIVVGLLMMIGIPIFYGVLGFIVGTISGFIYNIAAGVVGGIKLELESTAVPYSPPPPPQWAPSQ